MTSQPARCLYLRLGLATILLAWPSAAAAQQATFVDPLLRLFARPGTEAVVAAAARSQAATVPVGESVIVEVAGVAVTGTADAPRVGIFVQVRGPGGVASLRAAGADVGATVNDIVSATVSVSALPTLFSHPDIAVVQAARLLRSVNDSSMRAINAHVLRQVNAAGVWTGFAGQGALIGIVDSGIDYAHGDFRNPDGSTRIASIWDMTQSGTPPPGFNYGIVCDPASIDSGACPERDTFGHGTHVAGIAAGDGSGGSSNPFRYAGVAPLANLVVVKGGNGSVSQTRIVDGVDFVFREAARLSRPAVVNLSLGSQFGPHDGTLLYEQAIDQLSGAGRLVVVSAGNDGDNNNLTPASAPAFIHAHALPSSGPQEFVFSIPTYTAQAGACNDVAFLDIWHEPQDRLTITVVRPDGTSATASFGSLVFNDSPTGQIAIDNVSDNAPYPGNGDFNPFVRIGDCDASGPAAAGNWTVRITPAASGSGQPYHFWLANSNFGGQPASGGPGFNNAFVVSSPGNTRRAITVGAFVSRVCFPSQTGQTLCLVQQEPVGDLAVFSSSGPTRDGRLKPEITAPGRLVVSSLSASTSAPNNLITPDGAHVVNQGTSMAAPHVAGALAVLLQADPSLTPETAKDVLAQSARQDNFTIHPYTGEPNSSPNNSWGYGKLDVQAALEALGGINIVATVTIVAEPALSGTPLLSRAGSRRQLLRIQLQSQGTGPARVDAFGFEATGNDPAARVVVVRDTDNDGQIDEGEPLVGSTTVALEPGQPASVTVPAGIVINPGETINLLAGIEFSGEVPHNTGFQLTYLPAGTTASAVSGAGIVLLEQPAANVASGVSRSTVLGEDEFVSLSENPVRSQRLIMNFRVRPDRASIYTTTGRRVRDLLSGTSGIRIEWDLTNDDGTRVAPGVYLLVVESPAGSLNQRLMVLTPASSGP